MNFLEKYIVGKENKWKWFGFTILGGFVPIITTLIFGDTREGYYKIVDIVFLGLTMNISNLNLISGLEFVQKEIIVILSATFMVILCLCLGKVYSKVEMHWLFQVAVWTISTVSIYINFEVNNFVFKNVIPKQP